MLRRFVIVSLIVLMSSPSLAGSLVPFPTIPKAHGENVHGDVSIRKEHMSMLMHGRDETMRKGIRPKNERLQACLTCHAVNDSNGDAVSYDSSQHFCRSCHDYVAVKVDCFECHASTPGETLAKGNTQ